jgi:hypothetical protein
VGVSPKIIAHGALMFIAWGILSPFAIYFAAFTKVGIRSRRPNASIVLIGLFTLRPSQMLPRFRLTEAELLRRSTFWGLARQRVG